MAILNEFQKFSAEAALIGRILAGYATLEIDLMHCVQVVRDDLDTVLKAMFRTRGETRRIDVADAFGRQCYHDLGLEAEFEMAIGAVRYCLRIRNQYAHCSWWDDYSGQLAFANLEELARKNTRIVEIRGVTVRHVNVQLLQNQLMYYEYADAFLAKVNFEGRTRTGKPTIPNYKTPPQMEKPPLFLREP